MWPLVSEKALNGMCRIISENKAAEHQGDGCRRHWLGAFVPRRFFLSPSRMEMAVDGAGPKTGSAGKYRKVSAKWKQPKARRSGYYRGP